MGILCVDQPPRAKKPRKRKKSLSILRKKKQATYLKCLIASAIGFTVQ